jgi:hypothetical protein
MLTGNQASCVNQPGTFECFCNEGFTMNGAGVCQDNDECLDDPCEATEGKRLYIFVKILEKKIRNIPLSHFRKYPGRTT